MLNQNYTKIFKKMLDCFEGKIKLSSHDLYDAVYTTYGALDQVERLKKREENIRNCFTFDYTTHNHKIQKRVIKKRLVTDHTGTYYVNETRNKLNPDGSLALNQHGEPIKEFVYETKIVNQKTYSVKLKPKRDLTINELSKLKSLFNGIEEEPENEAEPVIEEELEDVTN